MSVTITSHEPGTDVDDFLRVAHEVYRHDAAWIPPLDLEMRTRLSPRTNPFFRRGRAVYFTARRGGRVVGRCSAQIDYEHLRLHRDDTGFFGFFDTVDDAAVAGALLDSARVWLRERGMRAMRGPFSLYVNEEVGTLVEGFEHPPVLLMGHARPWQARLAEKAGLAKEKDLLAWRYDKSVPFPPRVLRAWEEIKALPEVTLRSIDLRRIDHEMDVVMEIYNDAWAGKWAAVPALPDEVRKVASELRLLIDPEIAFIAELGGRAVGMCIMLPNLNEAIADLRGRLGPSAVAKLLYRTKVRGLRSTRLMMLGIRSELRNVKRYGGLSAAMYVEVAKRGAAKGYEWGELSWTREDDAPINVAIRAMGATPYKRYRVFRADLR